ncbi:MAG: hypothetical protein ACREX4_04770 [Gammaproteobacteria bacterium]
MASLPIFDDPHTTEDGLPGGEDVFLPCSLWLADNYARMGRLSEAQALFDVCWASATTSHCWRELLGNFPQALTHVALVNTARSLSRSGGPAEARANESADAVNPAQQG